MAKKAFEDELEAQLLKLTSPEVQALVAKALAPVEATASDGVSSPTKQLSQAAQLSSLPKQPNQAAYLSSPTGVPAGVSSPTKQLSQAAQLSSLPKQSNQAAQPNSLPKQPNSPNIRLEPKVELFTPAQQAVLRYFQLNGSHVTSYDIIAKDSKVPRGTVRQIIDKMVRLQILDREPWRQGRDCGLSFTFYGASGCTQQPNQAAQPSSLPKQPNQAPQNPPLMKIDREDLNLSISLEEMKLNWPTLVAAGFGPQQLAQIEANLLRIKESPEQVFRGLAHAEWELENGKMLDKEGRPIQSPCDWVFRALARTGYYRRPVGFCSPEEQALKDAADEQERLRLERTRLTQERFYAWRDSLTPDAREKALQGHPGGPVDPWLRKKWEEIENQA